MSGLCLVNIKNHNLKYEQLNELANNLIAIALKNNVALCFNCQDYAEEIIKEEKMKDFFFLSSSFLYRNCEFLDLTSLLLRICNFSSLDDVDLDILPNKDEFYKDFCNEFKFFNEIIKCIHNYTKAVIEIYITDQYGPNFFVEDFQVIQTKKEDFLFDLFNSLKDVLSNNFNYEFPSAKFIIS